MVSGSAQYVWSSYQCHAPGKAVKMSTRHEEYLLGNTDLIRQSVYLSLYRAHVGDKRYPSGCEQGVGTGRREVQGRDRTADQPTGKAGDDGPTQAAIRSEVSFI